MWKNKQCCVFKVQIFETSLNSNPVFDNIKAFFSALAIQHDYKVCVTVLGKNIQYKLLLYALTPNISECKTVNCLQPSLFPTTLSPVLSPPPHLLFTVSDF